MTFIPTYYLKSCHVSYTVHEIKRISIMELPETVNSSILNYSFLFTVFSSNEVSHLYVIKENDG